MGQSPFRRTLQTVLAHGVVVVVDDMYGPGDGQYVDQRGHGQKYGVAGCVGVGEVIQAQQPSDDRTVIDRGQADTGAQDTDEKHQEGQAETAKT